MIKKIILSILIWKKKTFYVSFVITSFEFLSNHMWILSPNLWRQKYWGNWTSTHKGPNHCNIKLNYTQKSVSSSWKTNSNSKRPTRGLVEGLGISISLKTWIMEIKGDRCKRNNMSCIHLLLGLLLGEYCLEYIFQFKKKKLKIIILLLLLCQHLCKRFQNICNFHRFWNIFTSPFSVKKHIL